jgi:MFS family permease
MEMDEEPNEKQMVNINRMLAEFFYIPCKQATGCYNLPCIKEDLQLNYTTSTFLAMSYDVGYLLTLILAGYFAKYISKKKAVILGLSIVAFTSLFSSYFSSYSQLIFIRIIAGIGFSLYFTSGNSLIVDYFPLNERGRAFGIHSTGSTAGRVYGNILGGTLVGFLPWRMSFGVYGLFSLLVVALIAFLFHDKRDKKEPKKASTVGKIDLKALITDRGFWVYSIVNAATFACMMIITTFMPLVLTGYKGMSLPLTTNLMSLLLFVSAGGALTLGVLSDRFESYRLMAVVFLASGIFSFLIIITGSITLIVIELVMLGFGMVGNAAISISLLTSKGGIFSEPFSLGVFNTIGLSAALLFTTISGKLADVAGVSTVLCVAGIIYLVAGLWISTCRKKALVINSK